MKDVEYNSKAPQSLNFILECCKLWDAGYAKICFYLLTLSSIFLKEFRVSKFEDTSLENKY